MDEHVISEQTGSPRYSEDPVRKLGVEGLKKARISRERGMGKVGEKN